MARRLSSVCLSVRPSVCKHFAQIASSSRQMARLRPNLHTMVSRWACIKDVLKVKVKVKGHVIRALLWCHEIRFFSWANGWIATKLAHGDLHVSVHPGCAQGQGHGHMTWLHKNRFFFPANGCILTKLSLSVTFPSVCPFRFLPFSNPQMAVSLLCEFRNSSQFTHR